MDAIKPDESAHEKRLVIFTSNYQGGILQFLYQIAGVFKKLNYDVTVFVPNNADDTEDTSGALKTIRYQRYKSVMPYNRFSAEITRKIMEVKPERVLFCDDGIISSQTVLALRNACRTTMFIHDIKSHPAKFKLYQNIKMLLEIGFRSRALKKANQIILLSENSYNMFGSAYPAYINKAAWMPLGAHVPETEPIKPAELEKCHDTGYFLFFGRISRYKGVINLLLAYDLISEEEKPTLIIAGNGEFDEKEKELINKNGRVLAVNRFIRDGEMLYLIKNARAVILPYTEASQSGVIPIAYYYGIPVITSNVQGLTEFVIDGETGIICSDIGEMKEAILRIRDGALHKKLCEGAYRYHRERLNWEENLSRVIRENS